MHTHSTFSEIYRRHYQAIYRYLLARTADAGLAEDLAGDVFFKAWRARRHFDDARTPALNWIMRIARNTLIDHWRRSGDFRMDVEAVEHLPWTGAGPDEFAEQEERSAILLAAVAALPGRQKAVVMLRFMEGKSTREAATVLGITEGNVRAIQLRALRALRKDLHDQSI